MLLQFLSKLRPRYFDPLSPASLAVDESEIEFDIDEVFQVQGVGVVTSGTVRNGSFAVNQKLLLGPFNDGSFRQALIKTIHMKRTPVDSVKRGDSCAMAIRPVKRKEMFTRQDVRKGMVLIDSVEKNPPTYRFIAEVLVLTHHTTIKPKYQPVIHCGNIRQTAVVETIDKEFIRTGDKANVTFKFIVHPEYVHAGMRFVFREGNTKGVGKIVSSLHDTKI